ILVTGVMTFPTSSRFLSTLSLHDALPILVVDKARMLEVLNLPQARRIPVLHKRTLYGNLTGVGGEQWQDVKIASRTGDLPPGPRSEEHTSELQSRENLVCRLLLEKIKRLH